jgi:hypothetical protein
MTADTDRTARIVQRLRDAVAKGYRETWLNYEDAITLLNMVDPWLAAPPAPKKTVWVVRASWSKPEATVTQHSFGTEEFAREWGADVWKRGAISVTITPEER